MATDVSSRFIGIPQAVGKWAARLHKDQSGQVSLLVAVLVLGIGVGCCFVGGIAERVNEKIQVQNAADAAAYSNALWAARGMNAVTTCNHLMGELTALCIIQESLGAVEVERSNASKPASPFSPEESGELSKMIRDNRGAHYPEISLTVLGSLGIGRIEKAFLEPCIGLLATDEGADARHVNGAALYDSHIRIKELADYTLRVKAILRKLNELISSVITQAKILPPVWALLEVADSLIAAAHIYGDVLLYDLAKEKIYLRGLGAGLPLLGAFKKPVREVLIPALSQYAQAVVGEPVAELGELPVRGLVPAAQERTLRQVEAVYGVTLTVQNPAPDDFQLPLVLEEVSDGLNREVIDGRSWAGEGVSKQASLREFLKTIGPISEELYKVKRQFDWAFKMNERAGKWLSQLKLPEPAGKLLRLASNPGFGQLFGALETLAKIGPPPGMKPGEIQPREQNPTSESFNEERNRIDIAETETTQWVRATYPYVDSFRAPLRKFFEETVPNSSLHTYFTHWTNRFTLIECHLRQRERLEELDSSEAPRMYILRDSLPESKGNEPWTNDPRLAEGYFTLSVVAQRGAQPSLFAPGLFKNPNAEGTVCLAQAMFYNANGRKLEPEGRGGLRQPNTGWDTLNWEPPVAAPEWRNGSPSRAEGAAGGGGAFPWQWRIPGDVFTGREAQRSARVKLNWQSKLVPITPSSVNRMARENQESTLRKTLEFLQQHGQGLINH